MTQSNPLISIIVPVYKVEKYLPACIDSILAQTFENFELILVDDGSPDNCGKICDEYAQKDNRIKVIHQENGGVNQARKVGFIHSTGTWIMFVDSDDILTPQALSLLINHSDGVDLVSGGVQIKRDNSKILENFPSHIQEIGEFEGKQFLYQLLSGHRLCSLWRQLIRKNILSEEILNLPKEIHFSEDFIINFRVGTLLKKYRGIKDTVYIYNYHEGNAVRNFIITPQFIDSYDNTLMQTIMMHSTSIDTSLLVKYRSSWIVNYLSCPGIQSTHLVKTLNKYILCSNIPIRNKLAIIIANIPNRHIRISMWNFIEKCNQLLHSK